MQKYTLSQSIKSIEKLFYAGFDSERKIKQIKWEDLKEFNPIEKSFAMDFKEAIARRKIIEFLAGKESEEKESDRKS
jgi:hypothetical protein